MIRGRWLVSTAVGVIAACAGTVAGSAGETIVYGYDALGRLVVVQSTGGVNNGQTRSTCFDPAGNRVAYKSSGVGAVASCAPAPTPTPTPTPTNIPPVAVNDATASTCQLSVTRNLTANDTDADGDLPLTLSGLTQMTGAASATIMSASSVDIYADAPGTTTYLYTIEDARGATDTGLLTITTPNGPGCF